MQRMPDNKILHKNKDLSYLIFISQLCIELMSALWLELSIKNPTNLERVAYFTPSKIIHLKNKPLSIDNRFNLPSITSMLQSLQHFFTTYF